MKKLSNRAGLIRLLKKFMLIMKLTLTFLLFGIISVTASTYSQNTRLDISLKDGNMIDLIKQIEEKSEFFFYYQKEDLKEVNEITVELNDATVMDILDMALKGSKFDYRIVDRYIVLRQSGDSFGEDLLASARRLTESQQRTVSGKVTDESGQPLPGVSVIIKGTTQGTVTNADGEYIITNVPADANLVFSFVGMRTQEAIIGNQTVINTQMIEETIGLEEVVAVGYGTQKKVNLTGSVTSIPSDQLNRKIVSQSSQLLQGAASGMTVTQTSGHPGEDAPSIRIRGLGTFSGAGLNPLIIVDGVPSSINAVNPNDIESISILKDAASAAIYGNRAANGVILVTTKTGKEGVLRVSYDSYIGKQQPTELPQYLDSWDYAQSVNIIRQNEGSSPLYTADEIEKFKSGIDTDEYPNIDAHNTLFDSGNGLQTQHNLTFSGGSAKTQYLFSGGYLRQNGIVERNFYDRYNIRINLNSELTDNLKLYASISGNTSIHKEPIMITYMGAEVWSSLNSLVSFAHHQNATIPGLKSDGTWGTFMGHPSTAAHLASGSFSENEHTEFLNIISLDWDIINSLKITGKMSFGQNFNNQKDFSTEFECDPLHKYGPTQLRNIVSQDKYLLLESLINYDKTFGKHNLHVLAGTNQESYDNKNISGYRKDYGSTELHELDAGSSSYQKNTGTGYAWKLKSYFGRVNYSFQEKYLFEGNIRYDGSSRFSKGKRYGLFPSFSVGWRISEEDFFQVSGVEQLKIRGSYGILGNQQIGTYPYQKVLTTGYLAVIGGEIRDGTVLRNLPSEDISWETTSVINIGFDLTIFNGKLSFITDYFYKKTYDILYQLTVANLLGMTVGQQNAGEVENRGWDFELIHKNRIGDFSYSIHPNFSIVNNKLLALANVEKDIAKGLFIGEPLQSIYGYETDGLFIDQQDVASYATQLYNAKPGLPRYKDISGPDGVPDGKVTSDYDRKVIGNQFPKYTYGMGISTSYKGFDFYCQLQGIGGMERIVGYHRLAYSNSYNIERWHYEGRWTPENPDRNAIYPIFLTPNTMPPWGDNLEYWIRNNSFLRIKNLQLGYNIPAKVLNNIFINSVRIYLSGENIKCFDNYITGWDPEMSPSAGHYPIMRLWSLGVNIQF